MNLRLEITNQVKVIECTICHELKEVNIHRSSKNFICEDCKERKKSEIKRTRWHYSIEGNENILNLKDFEKILKAFKIKVGNNVLKIPYIYPKNCVLGRFERSQIYKQKSINLQKSGFDFSNYNWEEEFFKVRNLLYKVYYEDKKSILMIKDLFNLKSTRTVTDLLKLFGFSKIRNLSEGVRLAFKEGRNTPVVKSSKIFNQGWVETLYGKFYYRSSYELSLINFLTERGIEFICNKIYFSYLSSIDNLEHTAFPDFYLPKYNLYIETKNDCNFKEQDLSDRYETGIKPRGAEFLIIGCEGKYNNKTREFKFKRFKVLKSFIEDKEKEKLIFNILEIN